MDDALDDLVAELENVGQTRVTGRLMCSGQDWVATADGLPPSNLRLLSIVVEVWKRTIEEVVPTCSRRALYIGSVPVDYVIDVRGDAIEFSPGTGAPCRPRYELSLRRTR